MFEWLAIPMLLKGCLLALMVFIVVPLQWRYDNDRTLAWLNSEKWRKDTFERREKTARRFLFACGTCFLIIMWPTQ
jgi:hypothetical protein